MFKKKLKIKLFQVITGLVLLIIMVVISNAFVTKPLQAYRFSQPATVLKIVDGDTIDVRMARCRLPLNGNPQQCRIQLACIDTPEADQTPFFEQAKNRLNALIPPGTAISVRDTGRNFQERMVGEIFTRNQFINLQLVREGQAVISCQNLNNCTRAYRNALLNAEATAKREGLGVWNPRQPWTRIQNRQPCSS